NDWLHQPLRFRDSIRVPGDRGRHAEPEIGSERSSVLKGGGQTRDKAFAINDTVISWDLIWRRLVVRWRWVDSILIWFFYPGDQPCDIGPHGAQIRSRGIQGEFSRSFANRYRKNCLRH